MKQEVYEIIREMDRTSVETQLALHCAPLFAGLKTSNLFIIQNERAADVHQVLKNTGISCFFLGGTECRSVLLLYRFQSLYHYLLQNPVRKLLFQLGYREFNFQKLLTAFAMRYQSYIEKSSAFPHEMGLFLGYPVEDVQGFIENGGKNYIYAGYWKVYRNKPEKAGLFQKFDMAKESLLRLIARGVSISEALHGYRIYIDGD